MVTSLSWLAIFLLSISYWFQIYKIHQRKEVLDLSLSYHICLALGFGMLTYTAIVEDSQIFLVKQIMTTIPVIILISQILYFKHFYDQGDEILKNHFCSNCKSTIELDWNFCSLCGNEINLQTSPIRGGLPTEAALPKVSNRL